MTLADSLARAHRLSGEKTYLLAGSDENTQKMIDASAKAGKDPSEFLNEVVQNFMTLYGALNISYDQFIRTTDAKAHWPGAQALWERINSSGDLYKKEYEGLYCIGHEAFVTEKDLVDGKCPDHGATPEHLKEENYFFRLSKYANVLKEKIESDELRIVPASRKKEILSFISGGLEDVSFSRPRRSGWPAGLGVPVPGDDSQVIYVWCDALSNYISALGFGRDDSLYKEYWPANVHIIGKDILRFHAAIWPAMLLSAGLPLPKALFVHGFITSGGKKMSKTLGNIIDPNELIETYGADAVRYFLLRHISPFEDGDITHDGFKEVYSANLTNGLGNLVARVMKLAEDHLVEPVMPNESFLPLPYEDMLDAFEFNRAMDMVWGHIQALDGRITHEEPFKIIKEDEKKGRTLIAECVEELFYIGRLLEPFMPKTSEIIQNAVRKNKKPENLFPRL